MPFNHLVKCNSCCVSTALMLYTVHQITKLKKSKSRAQT